MVTWSQRGGGEARPSSRISPPGRTTYKLRLKNGTENRPWEYSTPLFQARALGSPSDRRRRASLRASFTPVLPQRSQRTPRSHPLSIPAVSACSAVKRLEPTVLLRQRSQRTSRSSPFSISAVSACSAVKRLEPTVLL